ncbi:MAG: sulfite exporter TauE/SafE family protein [Acidimicrobiia bacterium]|nr:sulfite exporter TauE/SafE family protein [Acidimicrobiia bacterium]
MTGGDLAIVLLAVAAGSFLKSVIGMGLPAIAVPVMSFFIGIEAAVVVVALPNFALNVALAWTERSSLARTRDLPVLAVGSLLGAALGTVVFVVVSERPLVALLVLSVIGYVVAFFTHPEMAVSPAMSKRWAPAIGLIGGVFQGAIGISGPIVGSWLHSYRLDRGAHVLSLTVVFIVSGTTQFVILILAGELRGLWLAAILACLPALATVPVGSRVRGQLSTNLFDYLVIFAIAAAGLGLGVRTFF